MEDEQPAFRDATTGVSLSFSGAALLAHVLLGGAAVSLLPQGFPPNNVHFWSNTVIPFSSLLLGVTALVLQGTGRPRLAALLSAAEASAWACSALVGVALFPGSALLLAGIAAVGALVLGATAWSLRSLAGRGAGAAAGAGALMAGVLIWAQRGAAPGTLPIGSALVTVTGEGKDASHKERKGEIEVSCGGALSIELLLSFESRSPDRTWTVLASRGSFGTQRTLRSLQRGLGGFSARYVDDGESSLVVRQGPEALEIEAISELPRPVYSHLNSWTALHFSGDAWLYFGPTGARTFRVEPADYPSGRPSQMANLHADGMLRVVRASDGEKGPFHALAEGPLRRGEPLVIELRRRDGQGCRLVFEDWSTQASVQLSPSAGWGIPENSIQFFSQGDTGLVLLALAETGPGRGWDAVGHAAGSYRNRLRIEPLRAP